MKEESKDKKIHSLQEEKDQKPSTSLTDEELKDVTGGANSSTTANSKETVDKDKLSENVNKTMEIKDHYA